MKKLVLIVEDNPVEQKMLQLHFEQMLGDYEVRTYSNPDDLMANLKEKPFAVVLDHFFPGNKTGLHYLTELKKKYSSIPVIYHTSAFEDSIRSQAMEAGAYQFIVKDSASLVRLRTALDELNEKSSKKGFFGKFFGN